jgi:hypothetical protein
MPRERRRRYTEVPPIDVVLLREKLGLGKYVKTRERDPEKRRILLELMIEKAKQVDRECFVKIGERRVRMISPARQTR